MAVWPKNPIIYEINTWTWLQDMSRRYNRLIHLGLVPPQEWDAIIASGVDAVWLMGVWERSPEGVRIASQNRAHLSEFQRNLPDFSFLDLIGSPYCIRRYQVDESLGGPEGLKAARKYLAAKNIRLILDFVPNHTAPDHPWALKHPEYYIHGEIGDWEKDPYSYYRTQGRIFACGRDPYFPAWPDVIQLNAFHPEFRQAAADRLLDIASQCDGVRCDMAMLVMNEVFQKTWGGRAGSPPEKDFWLEIIPRVRKYSHSFLFLAEAYWDMEWRLQRQGFDYCYDKQLYDRLAHGNAESVRLHLLADFTYQQKLLRFIENHDEPRAAAAFPQGKSRVLAVAASTLPGAKLFHEGQREGRKNKQSLFLSRRPEEPVDRDLEGFYRTLLALLRNKAFRSGNWRLYEPTGWPDNQSCKNLVAWSWWHEEERYLVVINLSPCRSQGKILSPWSDLGDEPWNLYDPFSNQLLTREGKEMSDSGLFIDLAPWDFHFFRFHRLSLG